MVDVSRTRAPRDGAGPRSTVNPITPSVPPHVIVAGCRHGGLAVLRSLGPAGARLTALDRDPDAFASRSRWVHERSVCPDPAQAPDAFVDHLLERSAWHGALVLETEDVYTEALARNRERLREAFRLVTPPWDVARWFLEKDRTLELARRTGVPHPRVLSASSADELGPETGLDLPVMVKPVRSHEFVSAFGVKLWVFDDWTGARAGFTRAADRGIEVVVQEVVPGTERALESIEVYVNSDGTWGAVQCNQKLRQSPPGFGVMRAGRTVPVIEDVRRHTATLLGAVGFRGYASVEFKRDPRDGQAKLIEVNPRLPRNGALMARAGTDFPRIILDDLVAGRPGQPAPYRTAHFVDLVADVGNVVVRERDLLRRPRELLHPYLARTRSFAVLSWKDPGPAVTLLGSRIRRRVGRHRRSGSSTDPGCGGRHGNGTGDPDR